MSKNLRPCPTCAAMIAKSARSCPQCGKTFTSSAGIILAVIVGLVIGWLMIGRTCSQAASSEKEIEEIQKRIRHGQ